MHYCYVSVLHSFQHAAVCVVIVGDGKHMHLLKHLNNTFAIVRLLLQKAVLL